jgi:signal transduction histidine kinase
VSRLAGWWRSTQGSTVRDVVSALAVAVTLTIGSYGEAHPSQAADKIPPGQPALHTPTAAYLLVIAACLVLAAKRRYPLAVLTASTAAVAAYSLLGYVNGSALLAPTLALYYLAKVVSIRRSLPAAVVTLAVLMAATAARNPFGPTGAGFIVIPALIAVALVGGVAVRNRNTYVRERAQDETRRRMDEERLRIARELHDVVAHTMATINVQAAMAAHVLPDQPHVAAEALQTIRIASKDGLRELRAILNVLRQADEGDPTQPAPGLAQLDALVSQAEGAGLPVTLRQSGARRELPAPVDLTAYRIVQESLTNVIRHAGPATATVLLCYDDAGVQIEVTDTGLGSGPQPLAGGPLGAGGGYGLTGMRERASAVGGVISAGPGPAGGFQVTARLPTPPQPGGWLAPGPGPTAGAEAEPGSGPETPGDAEADGGIKHDLGTEQDFGTDQDGGPATGTGPGPAGLRARDGRRR